MQHPKHDRTYSDETALHLIDLGVDSLRRLESRVNSNLILSGIFSVLVIGISIGVIQVGNEISVWLLTDVSVQIPTLVAACSLIIIVLLHWGANSYQRLFLVVENLRLLYKQVGVNKLPAGDGVMIFTMAYTIGDALSTSGYRVKNRMLRRIQRYWYYFIHQLMLGLPMLANLIGLHYYMNTPNYSWLILVFWIVVLAVYSMFVMLTVTQIYRKVLGMYLPKVRHSWINMMDGRDPIMQFKGARLEGEFGRKR